MQVCLSSLHVYITICLLKPEFLSICRFARLCSGGVLAGLARSAVSRFNAGIVGESIKECWKSFRVKLSLGF